MNIRTVLLLGVVSLVAWLLVSPARQGLATNAESARPSHRGDKPRCPVCGMFVDRHAAWLGRIHLSDGRTVHFDGAKDLFKYYFHVPRYDSGRTTNDIRSIQVTDYYRLDTIDGRRARYVVGGDVLGPMGYELIPFATDQAAREFLQDHHGDQVLSFEEVTEQVIISLDQCISKMPRTHEAAHGGDL